MTLDAVIHCFTQLFHFTGLPSYVHSDRGVLHSCPMLLHSSNHLVLLQIQAVLHSLIINLLREQPGIKVLRHIMEINFTFAFKSKTLPVANSVAIISPFCVITFVYIYKQQFHMKGSSRLSSGTTPAERTWPCVHHNIRKNVRDNQTTRMKTW